MTRTIDAQIERDERQRSAAERREFTARRAVRQQDTVTRVRPLAELRREARRMPCSQCWQQPGKPCTRVYPPGDHVARYERAYRTGLLSAAELAAVVATLDGTAHHTIVPDCEVTR
jgi:hypothetical protein